MEPAFEKRYARYLERIGTATLKEYFQIGAKPEQTLHMECRKRQESNNELQFTVRFQKQNPCPTLDLPDDLLRIIQDYNQKYVRITIHIEFPVTYPFKPPTWHLIDVQHNLPISFHLRDYYDTIVQNHNEQYLNDWSPAIDIDHDILIFFQRINYFDYILDEAHEP